MKRWMGTLFTLWVVFWGLHIGQIPLFAMEERSYETLPITVEERNKIGKIIVTLAEDNVIELLFAKKKLEQLGQEIHHVHPIRFLDTIFSDIRLTSYIGKIRANKFKWEGFMGGLSQRLHQEMRTGNVLPYLSSFSEHLGVDLGKVEQYMAHQDFEGLVIFLFKHSRR